MKHAHGVHDDQRIPPVVPPAPFNAKPSLASAVPQLVDGDLNEIGSSVDSGDIEEQPARRSVDVASKEGGGDAASDGTEGSNSRQQIVDACLCI